MCRKKTLLSMLACVARRHCYQPLNVFGAWQAIKRASESATGGDGNEAIYPNLKHCASSDCLRVSFGMFGYLFVFGGIYTLRGRLLRRVASGQTLKVLGGLEVLLLGAVCVCRHLHTSKQVASAGCLRANFESVRRFGGFAAW